MSTRIPYGSDAAPITVEIPGYPDTRTYVDPAAPWLPAGMNSAAVACDEINGAGINWPREVWGWDDVALSRPTILAAAGNPDPNTPHEDGQTVDGWIGREHRSINLPRDRNRVRSAR